MTQPAQQPTLGDRVISDLETQLSEPDPRYARKCRELAIIRSQYAELMEYVKSKADVLGLTEVGPDGEPLVKPTDEAPSENDTSKSNGKVVPKESVKPTT